MLADSFLFLLAMGVKLNILLLHYSHLECGRSASAREFLPLFSFALVGLLFQLKVQTTEVKSLNLIPCVGIHLKISSRTWNIHLYTLQSERFLPFLYIKAHPCHVVNAGYLKQYFQLLCNH